MRKLRKIIKNQNDLQKCCRWCKFYKYGKCFNINVVFMNKKFIDNLMNVYEDGYLELTLTEVLMDLKVINELKNILEKFILEKFKNISQKKNNDFEVYFQEQWEKFVDYTLKYKLETNISSCYLNHIGLIEDDCVEISNPSEFNCLYWE